MSGQRLILLRTLCALTTLITAPGAWAENLKEMWMGDNDIHYRIDDHMQIRRTGSSITARNRLAADCLSDIANAEYACYMAARVSIDLKDKKSAREFLTQAMQKNYRFTEPINAWRAWFHNEKIPVPQHPVRLLADAVQTATAGKKAQTLALIKNLLQHEIAPELILQNTALAPYAQDSEIKSLMALAHQKQASREERIRTGLWISPLYKILNTDYDRKKHKKNPDENELLYGFFNALSAPNASDAVGWLNMTYEKLVALGKNGKLQELPAYYLVYIMQDKRLARFRNSDEFKVWFSSVAKVHNIDENWLNAL